MSPVTSYKDALFNVKRNFLILGLTGYTGAGCSTCRNILEVDSKPKLPSYSCIEECCQESVRSSSDSQEALAYYSGRNLKIFEKLKRTWESEEWEWSKFIGIEVSLIIFSFVVWRILHEGYDEDSDLMHKIKESCNGLDKNDFVGLSLFFSDEGKDKKKLDPLLMSFEKINDIYNKFKKLFVKKIDLIQVMQDFGDELRKYGKVFGGQSEPSPGNLFVLPEAIRRLIKAYIEKYDSRPVHFIVDAFRNPFEIEYFKWRYGEFYLIGVLRSESERKVNFKLTR